LSNDDHDAAEGGGGTVGGAGLQGHRIRGRTSNGGPNMLGADAYANMNNTCRRCFQFGTGRGCPFKWLLWKSCSGSGSGADYLMHFPRQAEW